MGWRKVTWTAKIRGRERGTARPWPCTIWREWGTTREWRHLNGVAVLLNKHFRPKVETYSLGIQVEEDPSPEAGKVGHQGDP